MIQQNEKTLRKEALEQYLEGGLKESSIVYQVRLQQFVLESQLITHSCYS